MVPAAVVDKVIDDLLPHLGPDDTIIDGGNSNYKDDIAHAKRLKPAGIHYATNAWAQKTCPPYGRPPTT